MIPTNPRQIQQFTLDTVSNNVEVNARIVLRALRARGFVGDATGSQQSTCETPMKR